MRVTRRKTQLAAAPEHTEDTAASSSSIVRLGGIVELVEGEMNRQAYDSSDNGSWAPYY
jgi:hypothetical protein